MGIFTLFLQRKRRLRLRLPVYLHGEMLRIPLSILVSQSKDGSCTVDPYHLWHALAPYFEDLQVYEGRMMVLHDNDALLATQTSQGWKCSLPRPGTSVLFESTFSLKIIHPQDWEDDGSSLTSWTSST
ncbi:unnamed protein product [Rhizoctonia solani]|uniref:Uncharacterized protein n=1 Tax=Rhizoctonia solani TaxID=456999 RepID=A0A8H3BJ07_9AGAM|nr:uncharacterized protein RhiXN_02434 [Rhizoctonia solani]KAF8670449.1 hypothetical protein RHS04_08608 [Rhizoctonia solani]QRW17512.1 hypothetical protein RhiXN_02434 [Rhizoctonia solani]CAE6458776.1 unnamed protein product [Rhizoctonia solani]